MTPYVVLGCFGLLLVAAIIVGLIWRAIIKDSAQSYEDGE